MTADEITNLRKKLGVTQEKFAHLLGTTSVTVNRWENGKTIPSRLYIKELKQLKANCGSYVCRREKPKES